MNISIVAGARPNFVKIAPIIRAIESSIKKGLPIKYRLIHTGQHFDNAMSASFFDQLGIPNPDINLECAGGTQAEQTASIMVKFEKELFQFKPDIVLVVGDVNSTMACTITAKKLCIDVAHVEAGIRSGDMNMPEEINRIITDSICNFFFTTTKQASKNLEMLQISKEKIYFVGNTMIDSLLFHLDFIKRPAFFKDISDSNRDYFLLTLHRPSNVDNEEKLHSLLNRISDVTKGYNVIFPVHPRTKKILQHIKFKNNNIIEVEPQQYLEFIYLIKNAKGIITDSGGITEEATILNKPCITLRNSTERPETVEIGTNELVGEDLENLQHSIQSIIENKWKKGNIPELWDGHTSERIISILYSHYKWQSI